MELKKKNNRGTISRQHSSGYKPLLNPWGIGRASSLSVKIPSSQNEKLSLQPKTTKSKHTYIHTLKGENFHGFYQETPIIEREL